MSNDTPNMNDPLAFLRNMWSGMGVSMPGMVTPTFDVDELDKRIKDMKAVEGWLRMNLSMLQMTIQGLEMQRTTLDAVQAMGKMASDAARSMKPEAAVAQTEAAPAAVDPENKPVFRRGGRCHGRCHVALADDAADARADAAIRRGRRTGRQRGKGGRQGAGPPHPQVISDSTTLPIAAASASTPAWSPK